MEGLLAPPFASVEAHIAYTEDFFRRVNLTHAESAFRDPSPVHFRCECWQEECAEEILLSPDDWAMVRSQGNRFAVAPDHVAQHFEAVLKAYPSFWLIEKFGMAGDVADELARLQRASAAFSSPRKRDPFEPRIHGVSIRGTQPARVGHGEA